jgi:tRNA (mo5U34)-methyltransferase
VATPQQVLEDANKYNWYHHIPLAEGVVTPGQATFTWEKHQLPSFKERSVLDIGAWDGGYSFLAEREGASRVVALDHYAWGIKWRDRQAYWDECTAKGVLPDQQRDTTDFWDDSLPGRRPFDFAHRTLGSHVETVVADFTTVDLQALGQFDVVVYLGVLYHMPEPLTCLQRVRRVTRQVAAIATVALDIPALNDRRLLQFAPGNEIDGDFGNWYLPSVSALVGLCRAAGFARVEVVVGPPPHAEHDDKRPRTSRWGARPRSQEVVETFGAMVHAFVD